jgi:hypothetical protein
MSTKVENILALAANYQEKAEDSLISEAKKKDKKKLDPKAEVRNRGNVCVPASSAKDKKDHFPINNIDQARNALARVHQYSSVPSWYSGSLKGLQALVSRKVHSKYPSIGKEKKSSEELNDLVSLAQGARTPKAPPPPPNLPPPPAPTWQRGGISPDSGNLPTATDDQIGTVVDEITGRLNSLQGGLQGDSPQMKGQRLQFVTKILNWMKANG